MTKTPAQQKRLADTMPAVDDDVADVVARFLAGDIKSRDRRRDGVTTQTNYSGANTRKRRRGATTVEPRQRGRKHRSSPRDR